MINQPTEHCFNDIIDDPTKVYIHDPRFTETEKVHKLIDFTVARDKEMKDLYLRAKLMYNRFLKAGAQAAKARELLLENHGVTVANRYPIESEK